MQDVGHTRSRVPGLDDHISFANYDLTREGLPLVQRDSEGVFLEIESSSESATPEKAGIPDVFWSSALRIMPVLAYHGFALAPKSD